MQSLPPVCDRVLLTETAIKRRVAELGRRVARDHIGDDLRLVTVLKGGLFFLADLCRAMDMDVRIDFLAVVPYAEGGGGVVRLTKDLSDDIEGASVILVEDIVDTGLTVNYVMSLLRAHHPKSLEICTLLDKPARRIANVPITYRGYTMPDRFLVGYGLDFNSRFRNLRYIASLKDDVVL